MNKAKVESIKKNFVGLGPKLGEEYTNQEMIDESMELQGAIARDFAIRMQLEISRDRDVVNAIENVVVNSHLDQTEEYSRLKRNFTDLGYTIGSFIKGMNGEKIAKRALKLISFDKDVKVLYNIALEDEDVQAEYDAIVIAPYGIFVIEVKNWASSMVINERGIIERNDGTGITYDLPSRMSIKEGLLREYLGDLFTGDYQGMLLFSNERAAVDDHYKKIPLSFGGSIVYDIRAYGKGKPQISREEIEAIANTLIENNKEQKTISKVDSEAIIDDYANLIVMLENQSEEEQVVNLDIEKESTKAQESVNSTNNNFKEEKGRHKEDKVAAFNSNKKYNWWHVASVASIFVLTGVSTLVAEKTKVK